MLAGVAFGLLLLGAAVVDGAGAAPGPRLSRATVPAVSSGFVDRVVRVGGVNHRFAVYLPAGWNQARTWPVVLYLHGGGDRGIDGRRPLRWGLATEIRSRSRSFPFVAVFPQCPPERWWTDREVEEVALAALEDTVQRFRGDRKRIYLAGLSMGGYGVWSLAARHPGRFAALVVICGGLRPLPAFAMPGVAATTSDPHGEIAARVANTPAWVFHGALDQLVPPEDSRKIVAALQLRGAEVNYTEYPDLGHEVWNRAFAMPGLWTWLLAQQKRPAS